MGGPHERPWLVLVTVWISGAGLWECMKLQFAFSTGDLRVNVDEVLHAWREIMRSLFKTMITKHLPLINKRALNFNFVCANLFNFYKAIY